MVDNQVIVYNKCKMQREFVQKLFFPTWYNVRINTLEGIVMNKLRIQNYCNCNLIHKP